MQPTSSTRAARLRTPPTFLPEDQQRQVAAGGVLVWQPQYAVVGVLPDPGEVLDVRVAPVIQLRHDRCGINGRATAKPAQEGYGRGATAC